MADIPLFDFHFHGYDYSEARDPAWFPWVARTLDSGEVTGILCCTDLLTEHEQFEKENKKLLALSEKRGKKVLPLLAMVHLNRPGWQTHAEKWFDTFPTLVGVKIHPPTSRYTITPELVDPLFEFVNERNLFVASHTCPLPGLSASAFHKSLSKFPKTRLVLYHGSLHEEAAYLAELFPGVYVEPSWLGFFPNLFQLMRKLGGHRKMLAGTDGPAWFRSFKGSPYTDLVHLAYKHLPDEDTVRDFCSRNAERFLGPL